MGDIEDSGQNLKSFVHLMQICCKFAFPDFLLGPLLQWQEEPAGKPAILEKPRG